jgi:probable HAF family extracellular repeat protein
MSAVHLMKEATLDACLITCFVCRLGWAQPSFQGLGDLPGGSFYSEAVDISSDGTVVVGSSDAGEIHGLRAFRWTSSTGMVGLPLAMFPWDGGSQTHATNADGSVLVGSARLFDSTFPLSGRAFRWQAESATVLLFDPGEFWPYSSAARSISSDGAVIVGGTDTDKIAETVGAFRWSKDKGVVLLGLLPGAPSSGSSYAEVISADGRVIAGASTSALSDRFEAFLWTQESEMIPCGDLPGGTFDGGISALSRDGSIAAGYSNSQNCDSPTRYEAFRYTAGAGMIGLGDLPGGTFNSFAAAMSADGSVIVGLSDAAIGLAAFIWDAHHGIRNLQQVLVLEYGLGEALSGWTLRRANGISEDGRTIVGTGRNPRGRSEAWVVTLGGDLPSGEIGEVEVAPRCPADLNRDATLNSLDFLSFLDAFFARLPGADFNRDKLLNSQDFFDFLSAFFAGCP